MVRDLLDRLDRRAGGDAPHHRQFHRVAVDRRGDGRPSARALLGITEDGEKPHRVERLGQPDDLDGARASGQAADESRAPRAP